MGVAVHYSVIILCVHTWLCSSQNTNVKILRVISSLTGGTVHHYPNFKTFKASRIIYKLNQDLHRQTGYDAIMRV
ncbi:hypothetical protein BX666DRAFT_1527874 [Dichotomocladium elegans]|nr:hypothetical protein BX666DRAFT_1527874 [Dichotomocladium elegans]